MNTTRRLELVLARLERNGLAASGSTGSISKITPRFDTLVQH